MKKFFIPLLFFAFLTCSGQASAAVRDFGQYTVDVPAGWQVQAIEGGCVLVVPDKSASAVVAVADAPAGMTAGDAAKAVAEQAHVVGARVEVDEDGDATVKGAVNGSKVMFQMRISGGKMMTISLAGDLEKASGVLDSIEDK